MENKRPLHTIALGGIGGDAHTVALTILRHALTRHGYHVIFLGIQNELEDFFKLASFCNAIMISSLDGHAGHYVRHFPDLQQKYQIEDTLWYIGGNLHIGDAIGYERYFLEIGFNRAFVKFTDINSVLEIVAYDLGTRHPKNSYGLTAKAQQKYPIDLTQTLPDHRHLDHEFQEIRQSVLAQWPTGLQASDLAQNATYLLRQPTFAKVQSLTNAGLLPTIIQARCGVPTVAGQTKLLQAIKNLKVRVLSYQVDSLTRMHDFVGAAEGLRESEATGIATMNGFPLINHGVPTLRQVMATVNAPMQTRHSARDARLLAEISFAGGVTAFEGGSISYNIPYYKNYSLDESIQLWRYIDRLVGIYYERYGLVIDREFFGPLTATLIPPSLAIVVNIIEALLAVQQGVKSISLGYAEQGNRIQDIAAMRMLPRMVTEVLQNFGYNRVQISTVYHQFMAAFPSDVRRAEELIYQSAITAARANATRVIVKTPAEAFRIPTLNDHLRGLTLTQEGLAAAKRSPQFIDELQILAECDIIEQEVNAILDSILFCGGGQIAEGIKLGFYKGYIDIPFSPSLSNRGEVMTLRDVDGAVRFLNIGNLQFSRALQEFHRDKISQRLHAEGLTDRKQSYLLVEKDVLQIPRGDYDHWPLYDGKRENQLTYPTAISFK